uniref:ADP-ribosyltransferase n=1 Tax=Paractinoplanes polyasparticus TaxID=2856853 RepID=UPI001C85AB47|nr:hypothetical protein [Actinoplanes polyasparticus]
MARTFNPAQHPRDRFGRFTKSRTVKANTTDRKAAREVAERFAPKQLSRQERSAYLRQVADRQPEGAFADVLEANKALRSGRDSDAAKRVDAAMTELPDDVLLSRAVPLSAFGKTDPASLQGMKVRDAGFAPTQFGTVRPTDGQVRMHIAAPAGTKAAVNPATGEVVLDRDTEMVVAKVERNDAGGHDMWLTVLPKQGAKAAPKPAVADNDQKTDIETPDVADNSNETGDDAGRAELMKLRVPELQARMRERGLKPGRMRKSQMVDALVKDETGDEQAEPEADAPSAPEPATPEPTPAPSAAPEVEPAVEQPAPVEVERSPAWETARTGDNAFLLAPNVGGVFVKLRQQRQARPGGLQRLEKAMVAYGSDPRAGDLNYVTINAAVRGHDGNVDPNASDEVKQIVGDLDVLVGAVPLKANLIVHRGIQDPAASIPGWDGRNLVGLEWSAEGYQSTSADDFTAGDFAKGLMAGGKRSNSPVMMRVLVPSGTPALGMSPMVSEVLLGRGTRYRIVGDNGTRDGVRHLDVEVVPDRARPVDAPGAEPAKGFDERVSTALTDKQALAAVPLGLLPRSRPAMAALPEANRALRNYLIGEGSDVHTALRDGGVISPDTAASIAAFDKGMNASRLDADVVFHRGAATAQDIFGDRASGDMTGQEWSEPGLPAVTASEQSAVGATGGRGVLVRYLVPAGTGALVVSAGQYSEILLDRGHRFRVVKDHGRGADGQRRVDVEVLPKTGAEVDPFTVEETAETTAGSPLSTEQIAALPDSPLGRGLASGIVSAKLLSGGAVGDVRLVTFGDGSQAVQKLAQRTFAGVSVKDLTDAEDLAGRLGRAIGAPVPEVVRTNPAEVFMEYIPNARPGESALSRFGYGVARGGAWEGFLDSDDGRKLGVLDLIIGNGDRHTENWLVREDGTIAGIDHGLSWRSTTGGPNKPPQFTSEFAGRFYGGERNTWRDNDLTRADVAWMRQQVEALRPDFVRLGRGDWLDYSLMRLDQIGDRATGTTDRVRP